MAKDKNSFILYSDLLAVIDKLPDEKAGQVFKHILKYVNDLNPQTDDLIINLVFEPIKQGLKRDLKKWEDEKNKRSVAGKKGMLKRWGSENQKDITNDNTVITSITNDNNVINDITKITDNVNVNVNVNDNVNDNVNVYEFSDRQKETFLMQNPEFKKIDFNEILKKFDLHLASQSKQHETQKEYVKHFFNWIKTGSGLTALNEIKQKFKIEDLPADFKNWSKQQQRLYRETLNNKQTK